MPNVEKAVEPSMEDILASIRKIIAEEPLGSRTAALASPTIPLPSATPLPSPMAFAPALGAQRPLAPMPPMNAPAVAAPPVSAPPASAPTVSPRPVEARAHKFEDDLSDLLETEPAADPTRLAPPLAQEVAAKPTWKFARTPSGAGDGSYQAPAHVPAAPKHAPDAGLPVPSAPAAEQPAPVAAQASPVPAATPAGTAPSSALKDLGAVIPGLLGAPRRSSGPAAAPAFDASALHLPTPAAPLVASAPAVKPMPDAPPPKASAAKPSPAEATLAKAFEAATPLAPVSAILPPAQSTTPEKPREAARPAAAAEARAALDGIPGLLANGAAPQARPISLAPTQSRPTAAATAAVAAIVAPGAPAATRTLEDAVAEMLRPMLRDWLDANMPRIVGKAIKDGGMLPPKA